MATTSPLGDNKPAKYGSRGGSTSAYVAPVIDQPSNGAAEQEPGNGDTKYNMPTTTTSGRSGYPSLAN